MKRPSTVTNITLLESVEYKIQSGKGVWIKRPLTDRNIFDLLNKNITENKLSQLVLNFSLLFRIFLELVIIYITKTVGRICNFRT